MTTLYRFQQAHNISSGWASNSTNLLQGELVFSLDLNGLKIGNGTDSWSNSSDCNITSNLANSILDVNNSTITPVEGSVLIYHSTNVGWIFSHKFIEGTSGSYYLTLGNLDDVTLNNTAQNEILIWDNLSLTWFNSEVITSVINSKAAPVNSNDSGEAGEIRYDSSYLYICVASNTWKRTPLLW